MARAGAELAVNRGVPFRAAVDGETACSKFSRTVQLSSGKSALVETFPELGARALK